MGGIISTLIILILVTLQSTIPNLITIDGVVPDLALVFLVLLSLHQQKKQTYLLAIWAGILQDILFYPVIGVSIAAKLFVCYIIINYKSLLLREKKLYPTLAVLLFSVFIHELTMYFMFSISGYIETSFFWYLQYRFAPFVIYNVITLLILYKPLAKLFERENFYDI